VTPAGVIKPIFLTAVDERSKANVVIGDSFTSLILINNYNFGILYEI